MDTTLKIDELDTSFIDEFEKMEQFYRMPLEHITLHYIYIDDKGQISSIRKNSELIENNTIESDQLIYMIKKNMSINECKYSLFSILKYNITDDPINLINDVNDNEIDNDNENVHPETFSDKSNLEIITNLCSIKFEDTIKCFQDLNDIIIIYYNPKHKGSNVTNSSNNSINKNRSRNTKKSNTRRIHIQLANKRTRKHR